MNIISADGTPLPTPHKYRVLRADVDGENTTRNEAGFLVRERLRSGVYKLEVVWRVRASELATISSALSPAKVSITFFNPHTGTTLTRDMYAGDESIDILSYIDEDNPDNTLWEVSRNLIQY
jgi:hypothetical protein